MPNRNLDSQPGQSRNRRTLRDVRSGHGVIKPDENFGNAAHTGAANTDEVDALDAPHHGFTGEDGFSHKPPPLQSTPRLGWHWASTKRVRHQTSASVRVRPPESA